MRGPGYDERVFRRIGLAVFGVVGIAALAVVAYHAAASINTFAAPIPPVAFEALRKGHLGVDFFFVLSGFIIYYSTADILPSRASALSFTWKRLIRVFVPYWPIGLGLALIYTIVPSLSASDRDWGWWPTITLLPSFDPPALSVAWTLQHELVFYSVFAVLFLTRSLYLGVPIWVAAIAVASLMNVDMNGPWRFVLAPINLEFSFGMVAAHLFITGRRLPSWLIAAGSIMPLATFALLAGNSEWSWLVGLSIAFLIVPVCRLEADGRLQVSAGWVLLGAASYAIYLLHNPLLAGISRVLGHLSLAWWIALPLAGLASVGAAILYHLAYERPALELARQARLKFAAS